MPVEQNEKTIVLKHPNGSTAEIYLYGATVTSWKTGGKERLFVSKKAHLDGSAAIRGGIPVVFPIFGPPPTSPPEYAALKQHGFARTATWKLDKILLDREEGVSVRLVAPPPPASFPHSFDLHYVVTLAGHQLVSDVHVRNTGKEDFKFQTLLHNYLAVPDISKVSIKGIDAGVDFADKTRGGEVSTAPGGPLTFTAETDRVYRKLPTRDLLVDTGSGENFKVHFRGFEDCTIWNPAEASGSKIGDMEDGGWNRYVCVEPGYVSEFKTIAPGEQFIGQQTISVV